VADQDRAGADPERAEAGQQRRRPGPERSHPEKERPSPEKARPNAEKARPSAEKEGPSAQQRDRKQALQQRMQDERDRRQAGTERRRADLQRRRPGWQGRQPGRERPGDPEGGPDDLWPPFTGPGWFPDRASRAHRALHDERGRGRTRAAPALSRAEIVDAAIAIADAEGSDAVSMRRIAQVLRAGTMSLYWHVANKEQLLDLMLDVLIGEFDAPEPSGDWREDLRTQARRERATLLRHAWVMDFLGGRPPLGPNTLVHLDRQLAAVDGLGLDVAAAMNILGTVQTYVLGSVLRETQEARVQRDQDQADITKEEWAPARATWRNRLAADGRFAHVVAFLDAGIDPDAAETRDDRFEFGLDCVIDGIAAKIAALSGGGSP
jgi:AcrR family transcriptional regulator